MVFYGYEAQRDGRAYLRPEAPDRRLLVAVA